MKKEMIKIGMIFLSLLMMNIFIQLAFYCKENGYNSSDSAFLVLAIVSVKAYFNTDKL